MYDVTVIGPALIDVLAAPFSMEAMARDSRYLDQIRMSFGGDALNESSVLTITSAGEYILSGTLTGQVLIAAGEEDRAPQRAVREIEVRLLGGGHLFDRRGLGGRRQGGEIDHAERQGGIGGGMGLPPVGRLTAKAQP